MSERLHIPIYASLRADTTKWVTERFLSPNELVLETNNFMLEFQKRMLLKTMPEHIFFLDKGARKIGQIFDILFFEYCPEALKPQIHYINIGRSRMGSQGSAVVPFNGNPEIIKEFYPIQNPTSILIVDDFAETNDTILKAQKAISRAYPDTLVENIVVYDKIPNWQGESEYCGVEEYTVRDYFELILQQLNTEFSAQNIHFNTIGEFVLQHNKYDKALWERYTTLEKEYMGSIPTTRPLRRSVLPQDAIKEEVESICQAILKLI